MTTPLDFWNYPDWLGDSRDNPRDPNFEPFWMRPPAVEPSVEDRLREAIRTNAPEIVCDRCGTEWFSTDHKCHLCRRGSPMRAHALMRLPDGRSFPIKTFTINCDRP